MTTLWYFPLESLASRYTQQLSDLWMPKAFNSVIHHRQNIKVQRIEGSAVDEQIKVGRVLDATGRGIYSLTQVANFLKEMSNGQVKDGDILYFCDFWTPGMEAIFYAAQQMGIQLKIYSTCWAQSVDIYDFTFPMKEWIRPIELSYANQHAGIFVASSMLRELLITAGVTSPIHVVSLPIDYYEIKNRIVEKKEDVVTFCSRLDAEKQPEFMLEVALKFLEMHSGWTWYITTSGSEFRSNVPGFLQKLYDASQSNSRLFLSCGLSKDEYYANLGYSSIMFNSSLQDWVAFTMLEASAAGCDLVYPNFRSFSECVPQDRLYKAFDVNSALRLLDDVVAKPRRHYSIAKKANYGRLKEADIVVNGIDHEFNLYKELKYDYDISE